MEDCSLATGLHIACIQQHHSCSSSNKQSVWLHVCCSCLQSSMESCSLTDRIQYLLENHLSSLCQEDAVPAVASLRPESCLCRAANRTHNPRHMLYHLSQHNLQIFTRQTASMPSGAKLVCQDKSQHTAIHTHNSCAPPECIWPQETLTAFSVKDCTKRGVASSLFQNQSLLLLCA